MQTLLFSDQCEQPKAVNVASVPQRSPFRYPGGKTWFVPRLREWLQSQTQKPALLVEPFVGGGIVSLTAVMENFVDRALMVELDQEIAAVWQTIVDGDAEWLADRIQNFELTRDTVDAVLGMNRRSVKERAFQTIIKNRTNHGGILAAGTGTLRKGEAGKASTSGNLFAFTNSTDLEWLGTGTEVEVLSVGEVIDASDSFFSANFVYLNNPAAAGETGYFGYRHSNQGALGDETYYGYLAIIEADGFDPRTFANYAFNDASGQGITVVPEPSTTGLLFGMAGQAARALLGQASRTLAFPALRAGKLAHAIELCQEALASDAKDAEAWAWLATAWSKAGFPEEARKAFQHRLRLMPHDEMVLSQWIVLLSGDSATDADTLAKWCHKWDQRFGRRARPLEPPPELARRTTGDRRMRIGFYSTTLREHAIGCFLLPLLEHLDRQRFAIYAFHDGAHEDAVTNRIRGWVDGFTSVHGQSSWKIAEKIRATGVDILIDLNGYFDNARQLILAHRPDPSPLPRWSWAQWDRGN